MSIQLVFKNFIHKQRKYIVSKIDYMRFFKFFITINTEPPSANISGSSKIILKANNRLDITVPIYGNPKPKITWTVKNVLAKGNFCFRCLNLC